MEALQLAGDSIDAVGAGANVGARSSSSSSSSNAGLLVTTGVATTTTTLIVIITGQIRHESEDATAACVTITSRVGVRLGKTGASVERERARMCQWQLDGLEGLKTVRRR